MDPIERTRVVERIAVAAEAPIALIVAPAGYGKSVALGQYLAALGRAHCRFNVAAEDAGLLGFVRGMCVALADAAPHARVALAYAHERCRASTAPGRDVALWLHAHLTGFEGLVAVDDLHAAQDDANVALFLTTLVERTHGAVRWVLASRSVAGLPVSSWQADGRAAMIVDERDLRYTFAEASEAARSFAIGDAEVQELLDVTAGWPAAMDFAFRSATSSIDLRRVAASTRDMVYGYLAEQVYARLDGEERALLALGSALPALDPRVLERAGFDRAVSILERLRLRTSFVSEDDDGVYRCHDLFREFLKRQVEREGRQRVLDIYAWAGRALEESGDTEGALAAYVAGSSHADVVRVLESQGFLLLERARADAVANALDATSETARRERPRLLALRGLLAAARGRATRAETLLRRAIDRAGPDRELVAIASLRLSAIVANAGRDTLDLLESVVADASQAASYRAEALSLAAAHRAAVGDEQYARNASIRAVSLLQSVDADDARARALQRLGVAAALTGDTERALAFLTEAAELAQELNFHSIASRSFSVLSTLWLHEFDEVDKHLDNAKKAASAGSKAGDVFDVQMAMLREMNAYARRGSTDQNLAAELELAKLDAGNPRLEAYVALNRAQRAAWGGRFAEALAVLQGGIDQVQYDEDRVLICAQAAMCSAVIGKRQETTYLTRRVAEIYDAMSVRGAFRIRAAGAAATFCSIAECLIGRHTFADRWLRRIPVGDTVTDLMGTLARDFSLEMRGSRGRASDVLSRAAPFEPLGYGYIDRYLGAIAEELGQKERRAAPATRLTTSEIDVLIQLSKGLRPKEIAARSGRSVYTIQGHVASIIAKLGCRGRTEAIAAARREGIIG